MLEKVSGKSAFTYALFAMDTFSKKLSMIPLKRQTEVTAYALKHFFEDGLGLPSEVHNDEGWEFTTEVRKKVD